MFNYTPVCSDDFSWAFGGQRMKPDGLLYFLAPYLLETEPLGALNLTVLLLGYQTASHTASLNSATSALSL